MDPHGWIGVATATGAALLFGVLSAAFSALGWVDAIDVRDLGVGLLALPSADVPSVFYVVAGILAATPVVLARAGSVPSWSRWAGRWALTVLLGIPAAVLGVFAVGPWLVLLDVIVLNTPRLGAASLPVGLVVLALLGGGLSWWGGRLLDRIDLHRFAAALLVGLVGVSTTALVHPPELLPWGQPIPFEGLVIATPVLGLAILYLQWPFEDATGPSTQNRWLAILRAVGGTLVLCLGVLVVASLSFLLLDPAGV